MIRVLIVDDSRVVREVIKDLLSGTEIEVIGEATNGRDAIELTRELHPDLVTMDVMMPVMDGLTAVEQIMAYVPTPILVLASSINRKDVNIAFEAIQLGALDVMEKPDNLTREGFSALHDVLVQKIRLLSSIRVISHLKGRRKPLDIPRAHPLPPQPPPVAAPPVTVRIPIRPKAGRKSHTEILAIGASTGGPKAVMTVLKELPENFPIGAVLVQHIGATFTGGFVEWLNRECRVKIKLATDGEPVLPGTVLVGPGDCHLELAGNHARLTNDPPVNNCRPSVDVLFKSVAHSFGENSLAVLLTGMGRDGAEGMAEIKDRKGVTIVQDEESSVIFGMPRAAIELGAVDKVMPLKNISAEILKIAGGGHGDNPHS